MIKNCVKLPQEKIKKIIRNKLFNLLYDGNIDGICYAGEDGRMDRYTNKRKLTSAQYRRLQRKRRRQMQIRIRLFFTVVIAVILISGVVQLVKAIRGKDGTSPVSAQNIQTEKVVLTPPDYDVQLLTINDYSRPGLAIDEVTGIVVHYTANPGTSAQQNRDYFEGLKDTHETSVSSHFVIGLEGELIQCIPCNEIAYASNERNNDTISIECCIADKSGRFNEETYQTLVHLVAWLCGRYGLTTDDVIRHYDVTGKLCPKYYVNHEDAWDQFKADVNEYIATYGVIPKNTEESAE